MLNFLIPTQFSSVSQLILHGGTHSFSYFHQIVLPYSHFRCTFFEQSLSFSLSHTAFIIAASFCFLLTFYLTYSPFPSWLWYISLLFYSLWPPQAMLTGHLQLVTGQVPNSGLWTSTKGSEIFGVLSTKALTKMH